MHCHDPQGVSAPWAPPLLHCGRQLLRTYPVDEDQHTTGHRLARIARVCLRGPEAAPDASVICNRIVDASAAGFNLRDNSTT